MAKKVTKGNKIEKPKQTIKRVESSVCEKCSLNLECKEYEKYKMSKAKIKFGVLCRKG